MANELGGRWERIDCDSGSEFRCPRKCGSLIARDRCLELQKQDGCHCAEGAKAQEAHLIALAYERRQESARLQYSLEYQRTGKERQVRYRIRIRRQR